MSYEFGVKKPDATMERIEFTPTLMARADEKVIDHRRDSMVYGQENKAKRDQAIIAAGGKPPDHAISLGTEAGNDRGLVARRGKLAGIEAGPRQRAWDRS